MSFAKSSPSCRNMIKWIAIPLEKYQKLQEKEQSQQIGRGSPVELPLPIEEIISAIPKQYRRDATTILQHMKREPSITWSARGELIISGKIIPNTHLVDLLKDAFHKYKDFEPEGLLPFYKALAESNVPSGLIKHIKRRTLLESFKNPKPPGVMVSSWIKMK